MQRIDERAINEFGIPRLLLMDHAGLAVARAVRAFLEHDPIPRRGRAFDIAIYCGLGDNGGDGLCAACHLFRWGDRPGVILAGSAHRLHDEPAVYARILHALRIPILEVTSAEQTLTVTRRLAGCRVIIDALLGIGLRGTVRPLQASLIAQMNHAKKPIVSVDVPSGLNADTGWPQELAVRATQTVTFGLPKRGFFRGEGPQHIGMLIVDDIGIPRHLLE
ncbi:MAG: NAD(P)H-hydrate epimerase [Candidatus Omnitrophica bacterium]|nr:NAD(P)H-hydrate epimerase [Candidatus Omnitrophota bacterium]